MLKHDTVKSHFKLLNRAKDGVCTCRDVARLDLRRSLTSLCCRPGSTDGGWVRRHRLPNLHLHRLHTGARVTAEFSEFNLFMAIYLILVEPIIVVLQFLSSFTTGDYTLDYRTPSRAKSSVVKNTFYARNGVFSSPSATDALG